MTFVEATHWRNRAEEARALANEIPDLRSKRLVRMMAGDYEELADLADERRKTGAKRADRRISRRRAR